MNEADMENEIKTMEGNIETTKSFYKNGNLMHQRSLKIISEREAEKNDFRGVVALLDGRFAMQTGRAFKNHPNGQLAWELLFDENGVMKKHNGFRPSGEAIIY